MKGPVSAQFEGHAVHTLIVRGRPAWIAREIGTVLGYSHGGKHLAGKITSDWADDFVAGKDFAMLVGDELAALKRSEDLVAPSVRGLLVLFESGLHLALVRTHMPLGQRLRRFLVDEVLPQLARTGAYTPEGAAPRLDVDLDVLRAFRLEFEDRRFRARMLRTTADALLDLGRMDADQWSVCAVAACEIALGQVLPPLYAAVDHDWQDGGALAKRLGIPVPRVYAAAHALHLFKQSTYVRPLTVPEGPGWTLTFRFSPEAVAMIEAWLAEQDDVALPAPAPAA